MFISISFEAQHTLPIENVIAVQHVCRNTNVVGETTQDPNHFVIHYAERGRRKSWRYNQITFKHSDPLQVSSWVKTLQNNLQSMYTYKNNHCRLRTRQNV